MHWDHMTDARRGFTLFELSVVIAIIVVLASIALAGLTVLRRQKNIAATMNTMVQIHEAVSKYMITWGGKLGDGAPAFRDDPWKYIFRNQSAGREVPRLDVQLSRLVRKTGPGTCAPAASAKEATHVTDEWGNAPDNVLSWTIITSSKGAGFDFIQAIVFRSSAGTPGKDEDDIVYYYTAETSRFDLVKAAELPGLSSRLTPAPSMPLMKAWTNPLN
jgi:prepilin-type N-terminal cleavage/methylation domain-containing protein